MEQVVEIRIEGMSCGGCVAGVARKLQAISGVANAEVFLQPGMARVKFDDSQTNQAALEAAVDEAGFEVVRA